MQRPYLLTYSYDIVLLYSLGCIQPIHTCQTLITLITLVTESFLTICTDNVNGPLAALNWNPPHPVSGGYFLVVRAHFHWIKVGQEGRQEDHQEGYFHDVIWEMQLSIHKRYLRTNTQNTIVVNSTPYESHIRRRYSNLEIYLLPLTDTVQLPVNRPCESRYLAKTLSVQQCYLLTYSYIIVFLYSLGCIYTIPTCQTLITLIIESFLSSEQITLTLSVQGPYLLTYSYDIVLLYSIGCIYRISTCQTLITLITLII